jgi:dTMP kinase
MLISVEGLDGCGKDTQSELIYSYLVSKYGADKVLLTRNASVDTPLKGAIRKIIIENKLDDFTNILLFLADRRDNWINVIKPALEFGKIVIVNRFIDSTVVYQGTKIKSITQTSTSDFIEQLNLYATDAVVPDLTLFLDINPNEAIKRLTAKGNMDHFETRGYDYFNDLRSRYKYLASYYPRIKTVNAEGIRMEIFRDKIKPLLLEVI